MTSPREQAIEAVAGRHYGTPASVRAIIDDYERTRARIDGAKMMPREATEEMVAAGVDAHYPGDEAVYPDEHESPEAAAAAIRVKALRDALAAITPKDGER